MNQIKYFSLLLLSLLIISGCSSKVPTHIQRVEIANNIVKSAASQQTFKTKYFNHFTYFTLPPICKKKLTNVYIEGDGLAWITSNKISNNPTPINPIALKLFMKDDAKCKIYIARPCQYIMNEKCNSTYWTSHRFSKKVLKSHSHILNIIKEKYKLKHFNLIGYSGGAAIATILSSQRNDIKRLITVAGNVDINYWTQKHNITPLYGSLNPADFFRDLEDMKQYHFIGEKDIIIDKSVFQSYIKRFKNKENISAKVIEDFTHNCCWDKIWKELVKEYLNK
jgi:hypothetical protein